MKGFFSFSIILALLLLLIIFSIGINESSLEKEKIKTELIALEQASKERTLIENNVDKIISVSLTEQIEKENLNLIIAQNEINSALLKYLRPRARKTNLFLEDMGILDLLYLNENSVVLLFEYNGLTYGEYAFTSNIGKTNNISSFLGRQTKLFFKIPIDYSMKVLK